MFYRVYYPLTGKTFYVSGDPRPSLKDFFDGLLPEGKRQGYEIAESDFLQSIAPRTIQ